MENIIQSVNSIHKYICISLEGNIQEIDLETTHFNPLPPEFFFHSFSG